MVRAGVQVRAVVRVVRPLDRTNYSVQRRGVITVGTASAVFGGIWRYLAVFGGIWRYLAVFGVIWRYLAVFGGIWRYLAVFGGIWRYLAVFGGIWRYLAVFGGIWRYLVFVCFMRHVSRVVLVNLSTRCAM